MPPTLSPAVKSQFEGIITHFNDPDQTNLINALKQQNPSEAPQIDTAYATYKSCFTTTPDKGKCLAQIASGTTPTQPGSGAAAKNITHSATPNELAARSIVQDFFESLKRKGITLTGDPEKDRETIDKEWQIYETANKDKAAISGAREAIYRWFSLGSFWEKSIFFSKKVTNGLSDYLGTPVGFIIAAAVFGLDVISLFNVEIKSDNALLNGIVSGLPILSFGRIDLDLEGINSDVGGTMNMTDTTFGLVGQMINNPLLDSWIHSLPNKDRPIAQNVLVTLALVGLLKGNLLQKNILEVGWADQYQPDIRSMVEQLMRYLFSHGDMGKVGQAHRFMPEINGQSAITTDVISSIMRAAMASLIVWNASNNAKLYVQGSRNMAVIGAPDEPAGSTKSTGFKDTSRALYENDRRAGLAMMMTDALVFSDIIMESAQDIYNAIGTSNKTLRGLTPLGSVAITLAIFGGISLTLGDITDDESVSSFIDKYKQNTTTNTLKSKTTGIITDNPTTDTFLAFLFGGLEALAAGYAKNRRAVVDSFALVNNMVATNLLFAHTANEGAITFENSGQGAGEPKYAITAGMKSISRLNMFNAFWAGLDAGGTAYLAEGPAYLEWTPLIAGLFIRVAYLIQASDLPEGKAQENVVADEGFNLGFYLGSALMGYGLSWLTHDKFNLSFKFENGQYVVDGQVGPAPGGLVVKGSFGPTAPTPKSRQEELLAEINRDQKILEDLKTELDTINAQIAAVPNSLTVEQKNTMATRGRSIVKSMLTLNTSMAKNGAELTREQISDIDQGLRTGLIAFNPTDPTQRKLVTGELLPGLVAKRKFLANQIAALGSTAPLPLLPGQRSTSIFRNPVLPSYTPEEQALADNYSQALVMVEAQIKRLESGSSADLIALYQENTGVNLVLQGFNPVLQNYKQRLEIQHRQLAMTAKLYAMMLPG